MKKTRPALIALTAVLALGVTACGSDDAPANTVDSVSLTPDTSTSEPASSTSSSDSASSSTSTSPSSSDAGSDAPAAAIAAAEKKAGGTAYEIDDQDDDGSWEVDVAKGSQSIEVDVTADGKATIDDDEDDLDDDDRAGLTAAKIDLPQAIEAALAKVDGTFDDAELEEDDGTHYWQISVETAEDDDTEVRVDVVTGKATLDQDD